MPPYNNEQKTAINQYMSFTNLDRTTSARLLKQHGWNVQRAVESYFGGNAAAAPKDTARLNKLFDKYKTDPDTINVDGTLRYLQDLNVSPEDIGMLIVSEVVQSPSMGEITCDGFVKGWEAANAETLPAQKTYLATQRQQLHSPSSPAFGRVYKHTFLIARAPGQKSIPLENAVEYWRLLFSAPSRNWSTPSCPWLEWWIEFLEAKFKKSVPKDLWDQTLKLYEETQKDPSLSWWSEETSAWPSAIDEFIMHVRNEKMGAQDQMDEEGMDVLH